jgi:hypothetical protein
MVGPSAVCINRLSSRAAAGYRPGCAVALRPLGLGPPYPSAFGRVQMRTAGEFWQLEGGKRERNPLGGCKERSLIN